MRKPLDEDIATAPGVVRFAAETGKVVVLERSGESFADAAWMRRLQVKMTRLSRGQLAQLETIVDQILAAEARHG